MMKRITAIGAAFLFVAGIGVGYGAQKVRLDSAMYQNKAPREAAKALLDSGLLSTGKNDSWERIGVGRVYYLGGFKAEGQAIFDSVLNGKHKDSDEYRIGQIYAEAGEWEKAKPRLERYLAGNPDEIYNIARSYAKAGEWEMAKPLFERYLAGNPGDGRDVAEVGAYYLLNGDRATAERMFDRAIALEGNDSWMSAYMAGAYLGIKPQD